MKSWRKAFFVLVALGLFLAGVGVARLNVWGPKASPVSKRDRGQVVGQALAPPTGGVEKNRTVELPLSVREKIGLQVEFAEFRAIEEVVGVNGMIESHPDQTVAISPRIEGKIVSAWGLPGDRVENGQKLVEIRSLELESLQTDLIQAWNRLGHANTDLNLSRELAVRKAIAVRDLLRKEMEQRQAAREVEGLEARLRLIGISEQAIEGIKSASRGSPLVVLHAPIAGVIVERNVILGETVGPGKTLFRVADLSRVLAVGEAFESQAALLRRGLLVRLTVAAFPGRRFGGRITNIGSGVDPEKRTIRFLAEVENPLGAPLQPNMFAQMSVVVRERSKVLAVPLAAIISGDGEEVIFIATEGGYERRPVALGLRDDRYVEVRGGLAHGERIVTTGKRQLEALYQRGVTGGLRPSPRGEPGAETD